MTHGPGRDFKDQRLLVTNMSIHSPVYSYLIVYGLTKSDGVMICGLIGVVAAAGSCNPFKWPSLI